MYTTKNRRPVTCKSTRSMLQVMVYSTAFRQKPNHKLQPYTDINKLLLKATCHIVRVRSVRVVFLWNVNMDFDAKLHLALREDLWTNETWEMGKHTEGDCERHCTVDTLRCAGLLNYTLMWASKKGKWKENRMLYNLQMSLQQKCFE